MKRRSFLKAAGVVAAASSGASAFANISFDQQGLEVVLRGGKCYYQNKWQTQDIGIDRAGKLKIAESNSLSAKEVIDVNGKIVSPGFIDVLSDNTANPRHTYNIVETFKITDGVTTALQMHGGSGTIAEHYAAFERLPHFINFGVSTAVMQVRNAVVSLAERKKRVEKCLEEGALGVSHSIEYQPTPYEEILVYAKLAKKYNRPLFLHLRYSSKEQELEGVDEAVRLARDSGAHVHLDHLHSTGGTYHMADALVKIQAAIDNGLSMTCCVYPYSFWATYLHSKRFDEGWQQRYGLTYRDLQLVGSDERLTAESFARYRSMKKLVAVPEGTLPLASTVDLALKKDFCMIASDGGVESWRHANSHPRGAGCFATAVRRGLTLGITLEKILDKVTSIPRSVVLPALKGRGVLSDGAWADLVVFDVNKINGTATVENPSQMSAGIEMVFVNGKAAYKDSQLSPRGGVSIRY